MASSSSSVVLICLCLLSLAPFNSGQDAAPATAGTSPADTTQPADAGAAAKDGGAAAAAGATGPGYTDFGGVWELHSPDSGVSAMHLQIMPNTNMAVMYDATILGPSKIMLAPEQGCRPVPDGPGGEDCWAHAVEYDTNSGKVRTLKVMLDTWCSSGSLTMDGEFVGIGGDKNGAKAVRFLNPAPGSEFREHGEVLGDPRWYGTQAVLADNRYIVVGGRAAFSIEYMPAEGKKNDKSFPFPFLQETTDKDENNLYPFVHLNVDGNVFILANDRSIIFNPYTNQIVRELPVLEGGARNYPASGCSALLPIRLDQAAGGVPKAEVMVCGGAKKEAYAAAAAGNFMPALDDCATIDITDEKGAWVKEVMPSPRVMGDMLLLPNGHVLLINGAKRGTSAWWYAEDPNLVPVLYNKESADKKFTELAAGTIPRMYHSSSALLIDGKILVAGSNTHDGYKFDVKYPTELRVEKFSPSYLDPALDDVRPVIQDQGTDKAFAYGAPVKVAFTCKAPVDRANLKVTLYAPVFSTHGCNMNQRILVLEITDYAADVVTVNSPAKPEFAPAGFYMLFVNNGVVPSTGIWVQLK